MNQEAGDGGQDLGGDEAEGPIEDLGEPEADISRPTPGQRSEGPIEDLGEPEAKISPPKPGRRWSQERARETTRGHLAIWSFVVFTFTVAALALPVVLGYRHWDDDLKGLATSVLPVVVGVVGTTTGFYFGTKSGS
jgi:hypothetical protein